MPALGPRRWVRKLTLPSKKIRYLANPWRALAIALAGGTGDTDCTSCARSGATRQTDGLRPMRACLVPFLVGFAALCWNTSPAQSQPLRTALIIANAQYAELPP